jgi:hypothetical protein
MPPPEPGGGDDDLAAWRAEFARGDAESDSDADSDGSALDEDGAARPVTASDVLLLATQWPGGDGDAAHEQRTPPARAGWPAAASASNGTPSLTLPHSTIQSSVERGAAASVLQLDEGAGVRWADEDAFVTAALDALLDTAAWARGVVKSVLANFRVTSSHGFTWGRINTDDFDTRGWRSFFDSNWTYSTDPIWPQPHYQSQRHAMFLWGFGATGWAPLYLKAEAALGDTLAAYAHASARTAVTVPLRLPCVRASPA